jgi:3-hydroxyisobutyrate dehydrogenase
MNITIIGCGEVGYSYAAAISNLKYTLQLCAPRPSLKVLKLTSENNISLHTKIDDWLNDADIVMSCVPGSVALSVANEAIPFLKSGATFADFSSSAPCDKRTAASLATYKGISFVDVAIMGSVDLNQAKTPLLCSGDGTEKIMTLMQKLGATIRELPDKKAGDAASLKLLRTIFMKGLSALTVECIVAAQYHGVKELLYEILSDLDNTPLSGFLDMLIRNHVTHACRQRHEVAEATEQLKSSNLPVQLLPAVEALFATTCEYSKTYPIRTKNPTTEEALNWLIETRVTK